MNPQPTPDRRRHGRRALIARATVGRLWPVVRAAEAFLEGWPCNTVGHRWVEISPGLRSRAERASGKVPFKCGRCGIRAGFQAGA